MILRSDGIILRQIKTAGNRKMLRIFTKNYGKLSVGTFARTKSTAKRSSLATDTFTYGRYEIYKGREYYDLNGAEVIHSFYGFGENLDKYIAASFALELTDKLIDEEQAESALFVSLLDFLHVLDKRKTALETIVIAYEVKLLQALGAMPQLDACVLCGNRQMEDSDSFSVAEGGVLCTSCAEKLEENRVEKRQMSAEKNDSEKLFPAIDRLIYRPEFDIVKMMRYYAAKPITAFAKVALDAGIADHLQHLLRVYIDHHFDIGRLKSETL